MFSKFTNIFKSHLAISYLNIPYRFSFTDRMWASYTLCSCCQCALLLLPPFQSHSYCPHFHPCCPRENAAASPSLSCRPFFHSEFCRPSFGKLKMYYFIKKSQANVVMRVKWYDIEAQKSNKRGSIDEEILISCTFTHFAYELSITVCIFWNFRFKNPKILTHFDLLPRALILDSLGARLFVHPHRYPSLLHYSLHVLRALRSIFIRWKNRE